jgi:hypothetical protein
MPTSTCRHSALLLKR